MAEGEIVDLPEMLPVDSEVLEEVFRLKQGDPNRFQSYWEMDEEGVEEDSMEDIQADPRKKILWAAENNLSDVVQELLSGQRDLVNSRDCDGYTPLHRASYNGHVQMVKLLLDHGADSSAETEDGWRPLHSAARWNQAEVASVLIQLGASVNAQTHGGQTALHLAASDPDSRNTLELLLMNKDIDISLKNKIGETAYDICRRTSENCVLFEVAEESVNKLQ